MKAQTELTCKYCGKGGYTCKKGLAGHRRGSKKCLDAFSKEQEDKRNSKELIECQICKKKLRNISNTHLKQHGITQQEYKNQFPDAPMFAKGLLELQRDKRDKTIVERYTSQGIDIRSQNLENYIRKYGEIEGSVKYDQFCKNVSMSLENCIRKWGEDEGKRRYEERCQKLKGQFTIDWFIQKYGEAEGILLYNERCKQSFRWVNDYSYMKERYGKVNANKLYSNMKHARSRSEQYYISKYGEKIGPQKYQENLQKIKENSTLSLKWFKNKYGESEGELKYSEYWQSRSPGKASKQSLKLFIPLYKHLRRNGFTQDDINFGISGSKEHYIVKKEERGYYQYDFTIKPLKLIIEYNGEAFHPNPKWKTEDPEHWTSWKSPWSNQTADEKYKYDQKKLQYAKDNGYEIIEVWSSDNLISKLEEIKSYIQDNYDNY